MNQPEMTATIVIIAIAVLLVAADIIVRLVIMPARKEKFIHDLLDQLVEPSVEAEASVSPGVTAVPAADLHECLLRLFEKSSTSREILDSLANGKGLTQEELSIALNQRRAQKGKPALPLAVPRRVAVSLLHSGLVGVEHGLMRVTEMGQDLNSLLQNRKKASLANAT